MQTRAVIALAVVLGDELPVRRDVVLDPLRRAERAEVETVQMRGQIASHFLTTDDRTVLQWLTDSGVAVTDEPGTVEETSDAPEASAEAWARLEQYTGPLT